MTDFPTFKKNLKARLPECTLVKLESLREAELIWIHDAARGEPVACDTSEIDEEPASMEEDEESAGGE